MSLQIPMRNNFFQSYFKAFSQKNNQIKIKIITNTLFAQIQVPLGGNAYETNKVSSGGYRVDYAGGLLNNSFYLKNGGFF